MYFVELEVKRFSSHRQHSDKGLATRHTEFNDFRGFVLRHRYRQLEAALHVASLAELLPAPLPV